jgi:hypothetical protein
MNTFLRTAIGISAFLVVSAVALGVDPVIATITLNASAPKIEIDKENIQATTGQPILWLIVNHDSNPRPVKLEKFRQGTKAPNDCINRGTQDKYPVRGSDLTTNVPKKENGIPGYGALAGVVASDASECYKYDIKSGSDTLDPRLEIM